MIFPRYKAKDYELKSQMAMKLATPLLEKLMAADINCKTSAEDFKKCKQVIIEGSISIAEQILRKAQEK